MGVSDQWYSTLRNTLRALLAFSKPSSTFCLSYVTKRQSVQNLFKLHPLSFVLRNFHGICTVGVRERDIALFAYEALFELGNKLFLQLTYGLRVLGGKYLDAASGIVKELVASLYVTDLHLLSFALLR